MSNRYSFTTNSQMLYSTTTVINKSPPMILFSVYRLRKVCLQFGLSMRTWVSSEHLPASRG